MTETNWSPSSKNIKSSHKHHEKETTNENEASSAETAAKNVNYISIGMKRFKELSLPVISLLNSLSPSQRKMALIAVAVILFWPLLLLALNLPWILVSGCLAYAYFFGSGKLLADSKEAVKEHLDVDVEARSRALQQKFEESKFPGKESLIYGSQRAKELAIVAYKTVLLAAMTLLDYLVTLLLNAARSAKNLATQEQKTNY